MVSQLKVNEIIKQSGSSITIGEAGDTVSGPFTNTPAFLMKLSTNQTISNETTTIAAFNTVVFDTNTAFDTSNYRFTVPTNHAGKYIFSAKAGYTNPNNGTGTRYQFSFYKNGSIEDFIGDWSQAQNASADPTFGHTACINLSVGDYVDFRVYQNSGASEEVQSDWARFFGYKLTGV